MSTFWNCGCHFGYILVTFFLLFGALVAKWDPGPKNLEKGSPETKRNYNIFACFCNFFGVCFSSRFSDGFQINLFMILGSFWGPVGVIFETFAVMLQIIKNAASLQREHSFWCSEGPIFHYFLVHFSRQFSEPLFYQFSCFGGPLGLSFWGLLESIFDVNWRF